MIQPIVFPGRVAGVPGALVALFLATVPVMAAGEEKPAATTKPGTLHDLNFKVPARQPLVYRSIVKETLFDFAKSPGSNSATAAPASPAAGDPETGDEDDATEDAELAGSGPAKGVIRTEQVFRYEYRKVSGEAIAVRSTLEDFKLTIDGKDIVYEPPEKKGRKLLSRKGYRLKLGKSAGDFDKVDFVLPLDPVAAGGEWTYTAPPTQDLPVFLVTTYRLKEVREIAGKQVAVIHGLTHVDTPIADRGLRLRVDGKSRVLFSIDEGVVLRSNYRLRMITIPDLHPVNKVVKVFATSLELIERKG